MHKAAAATAAVATAAAEAEVAVAAVEAAEAAGAACCTWGQLWLKDSKDKAKSLALKAKFLFAVVF